MAVVSGLLQAKDPKSLRLVRPFSTVVANHVLRNRVQILETANKVDKLFAANGAVSLLTEHVNDLTEESIASSVRRYPVEIDMASGGRRKK